MSWWKIAWKSVQQRRLASFLTSLSIGLGVCMVVLVLTIHGVVSKSFQTNSSVGYHTVIGAKGGQMSLALNSVFYLGAPVGSIPYEYYLAFKDKETRKQQLRHSFAYQNQIMTSQCLAINQFQNPSDSEDLAESGAANSLDQWMWEETEKFQTEREILLETGGTFAPYVSTAVPIMLGDTFGDRSRFKAVATTEAFFTELELDPDTHRKLEPAEGRIFKAWTKENDVFEAVAGYQVAVEENLKVGDFVSPIHGDINTGGHLHQQKFRLVGILKQSDTPNDRVLFVNMEGFNLMIDHIKPLRDEGRRRKNQDEEEKKVPELPEGDDFDRALDEQRKKLEAEEKKAKEGKSTTNNGSLFGTESIVHGGRNNRADVMSAASSSGDITATLVSSVTSSQDENAASEEPGPVEPGKGPRSEPLPIEQRELTAILVRYDDQIGLSAGNIKPVINKGQLEDELGWSSFRPKLAEKAAQAISPLEVIYTLLNVFVEPIKQVLLFLTVLICIVSGISILVSIYNSMNDRKQEIAIMRALGADRYTIMGVILAETMIISVGGGGLGWVAAHLINGVIGPYVRAYTGVVLNPLTFAPSVPIFQGSSIQLSTELLLVPVLILFALIVGIVPAITAYRTDVSENL